MKNNKIKNLKIREYKTNIVLTSLFNLSVITPTVIAWSNINIDNGKLLPTAVLFTAESIVGLLSSKYIIENNVEKIKKLKK